MRLKPDKKLLFYLISAITLLFILLCTAAALFLPVRFIIPVCPILVILLFITVIYLILLWRSIGYSIEGNMLIIISGIFSKRKIILFLDKAAAVYRFSLPFNTGFSVVYCLGGGGVVLNSYELELIDIKKPPRQGEEA